MARKVKRRCRLSGNVHNSGVFFWGWNGGSEKQEISSTLVVGVGSSPARFFSRGFGPMWPRGGSAGSCLRCPSFSGSSWEPAILVRARSS